MVCHINKMQLISRTSIEVDTLGPMPKVVVLWFDNGLPFWRMEVVIPRRGKNSRAVGSVAESLQSVRDENLPASAVTNWAALTSIWSFVREMVLKKRRGGSIKLSIAGYCFVVFPLAFDSVYIKI